MQLVVDIGAIGLDAREASLDLGVVEPLVSETLTIGVTLRLGQPDHLIAGVGRHTPVGQGVALGHASPGGQDQPFCAEVIQTVDGEVAAIGPIETMLDAGITGGDVRRAEAQLVTYFQGAAATIADLTHKTEQDGPAVDAEHTVAGAIGQAADPVVGGCLAVVPVGVVLLGLAGCQVVLGVLNLLLGGAADQIEL